MRPAPDRRSALPMQPVFLLRAAVALAAALSFNAQGNTQWVGYAESNAGSFYFDPTTLKGEGTRKRVWRLFEMKEKRADLVQSGTALVEVDCRESTYRYLRTMYFGGRMGQGAYLGGTQNQPQEPIGPGSTMAQLARKIC